MANDYSSKIKVARDAGYSDDEIAAFIGKTDTKMAEALKQGYSGSEILKHLEAPTAAEPSAPKKWWEQTWENLKEGFRAPAEVNPQVSEAELMTASRFAAPGASRTPLPEGISEAGTVASLGATSRLGAPGSAPAISGAARLLRESPGILREGAAVAVRSPSGELRPIVHAGSRVAGAAIGHELSGVEGAIVGGLTGPAAAESILPKRTIVEPRLGSVERPGMVAKLPTRLTKAQIETLQQAASEGAAAPATTARQPLRAAETPPSGVAIVPEPRAALPMERPGAMYSVPREQLPGLAAAGRPGAADVLQSTGQTILFEPGQGVGYPAPREAISMAEALRQRQRAQAIVPRAAVPAEALAKQSGLRFDGMKEGLATFTDPVTNNSFSIPEGKITAEALAAKKAAQQAPAEGTGSLAEFLKQKRGVAAAKKPAGSQLHETAIDRILEAQTEVENLGLSNLLTPTEAKRLATEISKASYSELSTAMKRKFVEKFLAGGK